MPPKTKTTKKPNFAEGSAIEAYMGPPKPDETPRDYLRRACKLEPDILLDYIPDQEFPFPLSEQYLRDAFVKFEKSWKPAESDAAILSVLYDLPIRIQGHKKSDDEDDSGDDPKKKKEPKHEIKNPLTESELCSRMVAAILSESTRRIQYLSQCVQVMSEKLLASARDEEKEREVKRKVRDERDAKIVQLRQALELVKAEQCPAYHTSAQRKEDWRNGKRKRIAQLTRDIESEEAVRDDKADSKLAKADLKVDKGLIVPVTFDTAEIALQTKIFATYLIRNKMITIKSVAFVLQRCTRTVRRWMKRVERIENPEVVRAVVMPTMKLHLKAVLEKWNATHKPEERPTTYHLQQELIKTYPTHWVATSVIGAKYAKPSGGERELKKKAKEEEKAQRLAGKKQTREEDSDDEGEDEGVDSDGSDSSDDDEVIEIKKNSTSYWPRVSSPSTMQVVLTDLGYNSFAARKRNLLTLAHKEARLKFAKEWYAKWLEFLEKKNKKESQLSAAAYRRYALEWIGGLNIIFSDEKYYTANFGQQRGWGLVSDKNQRPLKYHWGQSTVKSMCWMAIGANGTIIGPFWVDGTMNRTCYVRMLREKVKPHLDKMGTYILQQDGATAHRYCMNKEGESDVELLVDGEFTFMIGWPANSPDLNVIENFWWWVDRRKRQFNHIGDQNTLESIVTTITKGGIAGNQKEINDYIDNLLASWPRRLKAVIDAEGERINY